MLKVKKIILVISLLCNCFCMVFFIAALLIPTSSIVFYEQDGYVTAAAVASVPISGTVVFETVNIALQKDETAFLQFSIRSDRTQANMLLNALYDHELINVQQNGFGIMITALREGETAMQTLTDDGIKTVAHITVKNE